MSEEFAQRGQYSSNGAYPQELPDRWRFPDGTIRTDLPELSDEELKELGWFGPIQMPPTPGTSYFTHEYIWNSQTLVFDAVEFDRYNKEKRVDYQKFWDELIDTSAYNTIKLTASQSLPANTLATEFIALLSDAKNGHANIQKIQQMLFEILDNILFTQEEIEEIQSTFMNSGMFSIYVLESPYYNLNDL